MVERLSSYGLKFSDPIVSASDSEYFSYGLTSKLWRVGFDALDECSIIDFLESSEAMEFINATVIKFLKDTIASNVADTKQELDSIECQLEEELQKYKLKVNEKRLELYKQLSPEDALELEKRRAASRMSAKLDEIKHFHHKNKVGGERVHYNNPFSTEDNTL